jgi:hypothetical protein
MITVDGSGDAPHIAAGMDSAAASGDTLMIGPGTYTGEDNRDIDLAGKQVYITSQDGAATTIINCQGEGRAFLINSGQDQSTVIEGLSVQNGSDALAGGAIICEGTSPTIRDNIFAACTAAAGGAIACISSAEPLITGNAIIDCIGGISVGGGIYSEGSSPVIEDNRMAGNLAGNGGAIYVDSGDAEIRDNLILTNGATAAGGGIYSRGTTGTITIIDNRIMENTAAQDGGGVYVRGPEPTITGNIVAMNTAMNGGGFFFRAINTATMENNTVAENTAPSGSGIRLFDSDLTIAKTIIAFNDDGAGLFCDLSSSPTVDCCIVSGNAGGDDICGTSTNNSTDDPQFCGMPDTGDYRVQSDSPALPAVSLCGELIGAEPDPCGTDAVEPATWGRIKNAYR